MKTFYQNIMKFPTQSYKTDNKKKKEDKRKQSNKYNRKNTTNDDSSDDEIFDTEDEYETVSESDDEESATSTSETVDESTSEDDDEPETRKKKKQYNTRTSSKRNRTSKPNDSDDESSEDDDTSDSESVMEKNLIKMLKRKAIELVEKEEIEQSKKKPKKKGKDKPKKKESKKKNIKKKARRVNDDEEEESDDDDDEEDDDEDDDEDEEYDDYEESNKISGPGIILSLDGFGAINNDETDYKQMIAEDKNEKCDSEDEETFMKETYTRVKTDPTPSENDKTKEEKSHKKKNNKKLKKNSSKEDLENEDVKSVETQYDELVKLRKDLMEKQQTSPKSKILKHAIKECQKGITELVKKERTKNTEKYYKLVHEEPNDKKNTNEMSFFKKKLSHKEQMRVMKDLKEINAFTNTDKPYRLALLESDIPPKYKAIALQKLNVLKSMDPGDSEYYKMKNWVDGFMRVPYGIYKSLSVSITDGTEKCNGFLKNAKSQLDDCTYGLNDAKLQILQMVGQWISNPNAMGTAIAIKGPPGTGKTTLVKDGISKILGREFAFIALGGTSDASFMEGHSYTYEGSTWGKVLSILMECKCMNPVIYFDELDKISDTAKGDEITGILTHLTDTSQNSEFHDKYFSEISFDLSKCLFIFSYNDESKVNPILKDRMYRIQTKGYDAKEKIIIARKHLLPKIREQVNFGEDDIIIPDATLQHIIDHPSYCKQEQGVRNLKRCLEIIHTKLNLFRLVNTEDKLFDQDIDLKVSFPFTVEKSHVETLIKSDDPANQSMLAMYV